MKKVETHTKWKEFINVKGEICRYRYELAGVSGKEVQYGTAVFLVNGAGKRLIKPEMYWISEQEHSERNGAPMSQAEMIKSKWGTGSKR